MKNSEMLKFILGYFKTKKMCNYAVKKIFFAVRYVPDKYEIKNKCNKALLENGATLAPVYN